MDTYEVNGFDPEPTQPSPSPAGKPSPFADSPYVMYEPQEPAQESEPAPVREPAYNPEPVEEKPRKGKGKKVLKTLVAAILIVALVATGCGITAVCVNEYWQAQNEATLKLLGAMNDKIADLQEQIKDNSYTGNGNSVSGTPNQGADGGLTVGQVYAQCHKSVVSITTDMGSGSGFIISADGYIISNHHVVADASRYTVTMYDGQEYTAKLIGTYSDNDLAVLKIEGTDLPVAKIGSSDDLIVGDQVVAIGNALGELSNTMTSGIISGKDRVVNTEGAIINMIQTDAAINPGNSGGPLFNMNGEVIGITTAKYSGSTGSGASIEGLGFAIPIDDVKSMIVEIVTTGKVSSPYMGVMVTNAYDGFGVYVDSVEPDGAAAAAGVRAKDIIVAIGEYEVTTLDELTMVMKNFKVGDSTTISVYRNRQVLELNISFGEKPADGVVSTPSGGNVPSGGSAEDWWDYFFGQDGQ